MDAFDTRYLRGNKVLLSLVGLWPARSSSNKNKNTVFYCTILCLLIVPLPQITYLLKHTKTVDDLYNVLPTLCGACMCFMKPIGLRSETEKFEMLIQHVRYDWRLLAKKREDTRIFMEYVERSRIFTKAYLTLISTSAISYVTAPLTVPILDAIIATNVTRPKQLPHPAEFFLDLEKYYYFLLLITYAGYFACCVVVIANDTVYFMLLQHACGMLAILCRRLETIAAYDKCGYNDRDGKSKRGKDVENMAQCVQLQLRIERLIQLIESTFALTLITDIGAGVLFQCSACVMIVTRRDVMEVMRNGPLLLAQMARLFFNSWIGQQIIDHSSRLSVATYRGMWYETSLETKKILPFLLAKCQKSYHITMVKLYVISLESYGKIMRTSVSYITLMISLSSDNNM